VVATELSHPSGQTTTLYWKVTSYLAAVTGDRLMKNLYLIFDTNKALCTHMCVTMHSSRPECVVRCFREVRWILLCSSPLNYARSIRPYDVSKEVPCG
jgi:hypothetical protein